MDEVLQRILDLIPKDPVGKYVRGSKKELADYLGLPHNIVAEWVSGRNKSYLKYLYQISKKYNVSVEWLRGETDEKKPTVKDDGPISAEAVKLLLPKMSESDLWDLFNDVQKEIRGRSF